MREHPGEALRGDEHFGALAHLRSGDDAAEADEERDMALRLRVGDAVTDEGEWSMVGWQRLHHVDLAAVAPQRRGAVEVDVGTFLGELQWHRVHVRQRDAEVRRHALHGHQQAAADDADLLAQGLQRLHDGRGIGHQVLCVEHPDVVQLGAARCQQRQTTFVDFGQRQRAVHRLFGEASAGDRLRGY